MDLTVSLIFDANFGDRILDLISTSAIWAVESPLNSAAAKQARSLLAGKKAVTRDSVSNFEFDPSESKYLSLHEILTTIEDHHLWTKLNVYGLELTKQVEDGLRSEFEASSVNPTDFGFSALRQI